jgi:hypothetical protein
MKSSFGLSCRFDDGEMHPFSATRSFVILAMPDTREGLHAGATVNFPIVRVLISSAVRRKQPSFGRRLCEFRGRRGWRSSCAVTSPGLVLTTAHLSVLVTTFFVPNLTQLFLRELAALPKENP